MVCRGCGKPNEVSARCCTACGRRPVPGRLGAADQGFSARFCSDWGVSVLESELAVTESGTVVSVVCADLAASTPFKQLDAELARRMIDRSCAALGSAVQVHAGTLVRVTSGGVTTSLLAAS